MAMHAVDTFFETCRLALKNLRLHKLRSSLTALGIIFGVAAVICMLSISEGASADEMRMIQLLGTHNIILSSIKPEGTQKASQEMTRMIEYGLTHADLQLLRATVPGVRCVIPLKTVAFSIRHRDKRLEWEVIGTTPEFFETVNITVADGRSLVTLDMENRSLVCVIGAHVARELFSFEDPMGQSIFVESRLGTVPYEVVGVLSEVVTAGAPARGVEERNLNREVYIPYTTGAAYYGSVSVRASSGSRETAKVDYTAAYVNVAILEEVIPVSEMATRVLERNHKNRDYEVKVPLARLKLAQKKKANQQLTLGFIAGISLLVGGIGIMNIMLASVTERTREIGIRRALGACQRHIIGQFLVETVTLSTAGGLMGVILGYVAAHLVNRIAHWETIVQPWTIAVSFSLSALVGIFFGMYPAMTAARLDPIEALRHE